MRILVTGSSGFIGKYVVEELVKQGHSVITSSRSAVPATDWYGKTTHIQFDIKNSTLSTDLYEFFQKPDCLIHLAWSDLDNYYAESHIEEQLPLHIAFLRNLISNGLKRVTVAGTCMEYGLQEGCLSESIKTDPITPYAIAKDVLRRELILLSSIYKYRLHWLRYFYMYGHDQRDTSLIPLLDKAIENGDEVFNMSGGEQLRDYLSVESVALYTIKIALLSSGREIVNVCSGNPISVRSLIENRIAEKGSTIKLNLGYYPYPQYEPMAYWGDDSFLRKLDT